MDLSISGAGSLSGSYLDQQTFGAQVVSKTMDYMNDQGTSSAAPYDADTFGAAVVSKTLDYMNTDSTSPSMDQSYSFQKDVLSAPLMVAQHLVDMMV